MYTFIYLMTTDGGTPTPTSVSQLTTNHDQIILALIAIIATSIAALVYTIRNNTIIKSAARDAYDTNKAVNNIGPGEHRLYDLIAHIKEEIIRLSAAQDEFAKKGWGSLPSDISTASGLTEVIRELQHDSKSVHEKLDSILHELEDHVQWEMTQKYKGSL